jgi:segregation and condensation protein A
VKDFAVHVPEYEGPLDLLLTIVRNHDLSVAQLPLAPITAQYLAYIDQATSLDVNLSMEWIEMAARLIYWKSASLLPRDPALPDPTDVLAQELGRELKGFNDRQLAQAKDFLSGLGSGSERSHSKSNNPETIPGEPGDEAAPASLWTLRQKAQLLREIFRVRRAKDIVDYEPTDEGSSVETMAQWTSRKLQHVQMAQWIEVDPWLEEVNTLPNRISLFLALLEMARTEVICLEQRAEALFLLRRPPHDLQ